MAALRTIGRSAARLGWHDIHFYVARPIEFLDANVLAHEVEHVDHYHCLERVQIGRLDEAYQG